MKLPDIISIRIDRKQLVNELRAMNDNYIELWINSQDLRTITLKDRYKTIITKTKN